MANRARLLLVLLIVASGGLYLIGNGSVALWDRDEPRYAQTSRQMWQTRDWVVPHYLDRIRTAKPALIYWCQAAAMEVFGDSAFAARFPSVVATVALLILLSVVLWKPLGAERTVWTVFVFATSALVIAAAKMCLTDAVLLVWVTIAQICLYLIWQKRASWPVVLIMAVAIGLAGLTKGPVILGFQAMTLAVLRVFRWIDRRYPPRVFEELEPRKYPQIQMPTVKILAGLAIIAAIVLPWVIAVNHRMPAFMNDAVKHNIWDRMLTPLEQHKGPPGYYLLTIWITFFPWSMFLPLAIGLAIRYRANPRTRFALAAVIGPWIMLECIQTKLPHYFLPAFPFLAFLTADAIVRCLHGQHGDLKSKSFVRGIGIWAILVGLASLCPWLVMLLYKPLPWAAMVAFSIVGIVYAIAVFVRFKARQIAAGAVTMGIGMMVFVAVIYGWYLPRANFLRISPRVADILIANGVTKPHQVIMMDYMEPSLAFHQGGTILEAGDIGLNRRSIPDFTPWMVVTRDYWKAVPAEVTDLFDIVGEVRGLAYADKGRWMDVMVIRLKSRSAAPSTSRTE